MKPMLIAVFVLVLSAGLVPLVAADRPDVSAPPDVRELFGAWQTAVPGGVWTTTSAIPGWETLHVSPGALAGLLVIYPDGTYVWNAYGGKKGVWRVLRDGKGYPIELEDRAEQRYWKVGPNQRHPEQIYIWDGRFYTYTGKRPAGVR